VYQLKMTVQRVSVALQRAIGKAAVALTPAAEEHAAT